MNAQKRLLLIPLSLILLSVIAVAVSAASITTSVYYDSTTQKNLTIQNGQGFGLTVSADSVLEKSMNITVVLIDSSGKTVANLLNVYTTKDSYSDYFTVNPSIYSAVGNYTIVSTARAASGQTATDQLSLNVLPVSSSNVPPTITSTPVTQVGAGQQYSYQVTATDPDGDSLAYSMTQNPNWLSMNSAGLVSGTAPNVTQDTNYAVTVRVSDGQNFVTQTYALIVKAAVDNVPPFITVISPSSSQVFASSSVPLQISTNEPCSNAWYSIDNSANVTMNLISQTSFTASASLADGVHSVTFYARDISGNIGASNTITFTVNTSGNPGTVPVITVLSPVNTQTYTSSNVLFSIATDRNVANGYYSLNGAGNVSMTQTSGTSFSNTLSLADGTYTVIFYATDISGNTGSSTPITFTINTQANPSSPAGGPGTMAGTPVTQDLSLENQEYLDQFQPKTVTADESPSAVNSNISPWPWILGVAIIIILLALTVLLLQRNSKK